MPLRNVPGDSLPDTLHELLGLALKDASWAMESPNYSLNMGSWHEPYLGGEDEWACDVCLAGAVMARSLGADISLGLCPEVGSAAGNKLRAINSMRGGYFYEAYSLCYGEKKRGPEVNEKMDEVSEIYGCLSSKFGNDGLDGTLVEPYWTDDDTDRWFDAFEEIRQALEERNL